MSFRIDDLSMRNILVVSLSYNFYASTERFYCLPLNAIEFNGVDTKGFLRKFVVLMYLLIF